jgi:hypothetical protein
MTADEFALAQLINQYRQDNGLDPVQLSSSLTFVAHTHAQDLVDNMPNVGECNLHSWSDAGEWGACCYTPDHAAAQCMWDKPGELTDYPGNGYEISAMSGGGITPEMALELWQGSAPHNDVILNQDIWQSSPWGAMGVGIVDGYANVWFGEESDPAATWP